MIKQVFKTMVAVLAIAAAAAGPAWGQTSQTSSLNFTAKYGSGPATADDEVEWTVTSDGTESQFEGTKGIHYGTGSAQVQYIQLSTSDIIGTITQVKVNASTASGVTATVGVTVGGNAFGGAPQGISTDATDYTFTGSASGAIVVRVAKPSKAVKALYVKSVVVTYTPASAAGGSGSETPTPGQNASGENIFQYCYDCQRSPAYPMTTASASLSGFENPLVGYNGSGFEADNTSAGPWKLEYVGLWSTTDNHGIDDYRVSNYQSTYNCTDVPVFRLYQWNATANEYQHASYGVVCAYAKVSNAVEHTAFFEAADGWGCVLTNSSHSSSMNITFDEDLTTGITTLIPAPAVPHTVRFASGNDGWTVQDVTASASATAPAVLQNVMAGDSLVVTAPGTLPRKVKSVKAVKYVAPAATVTTAPTATEAIIEANSTTALVNAGAAEGGTMMYAVTTTNAQPSTADFSATRPTAQGRSAGTYYVWYYAKADVNHSDSEIAGPVSVTLAVMTTVTWNSSNVFNSAHENEAIDQFSQNPRTYESITISMSGDGEGDDYSFFRVYDIMSQTGMLMCYGEDGESFTFTVPTGMKFCKIEIINNESTYFEDYGDWTSDETGTKFVWSGTAANAVTLGTVNTFADRLNSIVFKLIDE